MSILHWTVRMLRAAAIGFLLGLCLNGCTIKAVRLSHHHDVSNVELMSYAELIKDISKNKMSINPSYGRIGFVDKMKYGDKSIAGLCSWVIPFSYDIDISEQTWNNASYENRLLLVAHEMYHCACKNIVHDDREDAFGCPESYFNSSMPPRYCAKVNFQKYLDQVAKGCEL